ncbi:hypothetical protein ACW9YQ_33835 (plasmid) [Paraburkholderia strydomiana]
MRSKPQEKSAATGFQLFVGRLQMKVLIDVSVDQIEACSVSVGRASNAIPEMMQVVAGFSEFVGEIRVASAEQGVDVEEVRLEGNTAS